MDLHSHMCEGYYYQHDSFSRKVDYKNILGTCGRGVALTPRSLICMRSLPRSWSSIKDNQPVLKAIPSRLLPLYLFRYNQTQSYLLARRPPRFLLYTSLKKTMLKGKHIVFIFNRGLGEVLVSHRSAKDVQRIDRHVELEIIEIVTNINSRSKMH